jgi:hypothetical protein
LYVPEQSAAARAGITRLQDLSSKLGKVGQQQQLCTRVSM